MDHRALTNEAAEESRSKRINSDRSLHIAGKFRRTKLVRIFFRLLLGDVRDLDLDFRRKN